MCTSQSELISSYGSAKKIANPPQRMIARSTSFPEDTVSEALTARVSAFLGLMESSGRMSLLPQLSEGRFVVNE